MTQAELLVELEQLALALDAEIGMCQNRTQHIRATANASAARRLLQRVQAQEPLSATA